MNTQTTYTANAASQQVIKQLLTAWHGQNSRVTNFFNKYDEETYFNEVAPGRNRAIYLLGHLVNTSDSLLPLLGLGEKHFPDYEALFQSNPDRTFADLPTLTELKQNFETVNTALTNQFNSMTVQDWLDPHTRVSAEDFAADPSRNKLNVLISRTIHAGYHIGQLTFLPLPQLAV